MGIEIERKFLLANSEWKKSVKNSISINQGYLNSSPERTVRVRLYGEKAFVTIKGKSENIVRKEFEYEIPVLDALELLQLCEEPLIEKIRHNIYLDNHHWEIDVFGGDNKGLIIAEIELENIEQEVKLPSWIGEEVSHENKYYNSALINNPFNQW